MEMRYVIVRTDKAGVHAGYVKEKDKTNVTLVRARRIWKWVGAATLSELAMRGSSNPQGCKVPCEVDEIELQWIEIIPCTKQAQKIIEETPVWTA